MSYKPNTGSYKASMKYDYNTSTKDRYSSSVNGKTSSDDYTTKSSAYTPEYTLEIETTRASPDLERSFEYTSNYVNNYPDSKYSKYVTSTPTALDVPTSYGGAKRLSVTSDYSSVGRLSPSQSAYTSRYNSKTSVLSDYASTYKGSRDNLHDGTSVNASELFSKLSVEEHKNINTQTRAHENKLPRTPTRAHETRYSDSFTRTKGTSDRNARMHETRHSDSFTRAHEHDDSQQHHHPHCHGDDHDGPCDHKNTPGYLKHRYGEDTNPDEVVSLRQHFKKQAEEQQKKESEDGEPRRRPRPRRNRTTEEQNGESEERKPRARRNIIEDDKTDGKPAFKSRFAREVKMGGTNVSEPGKWIGSGFQLDPVTLSADKGHLIWTEPKGKLEIVFKYGHYDQNFSLFMDPQFKGVKVSEVKSRKNVEVILDGREDPENSKSHHHYTSAARNRPENNFEFKSRDGKVTILLEALRGVAHPKANLFKLNYIMAL